MGDLKQRATGRWAVMGMAGRAWWTGAISLATAAVLVLGAVSLADASAKPAAMSGSMPGMNMSGGSSRSSATPSSKSPICGNVKNTR